MGLAQLLAGAKQFINPVSKSASGFTNPDAYYRVVHGNPAFEDIVDSGVVRTKIPEKSTPAGGVSLNRDGTTAFPSFAKGKAAMEYARSNPEHYIIETESKLMAPSTSGRHGVGTTQFPTDPVTGKHLKSLPASEVKVFKPSKSGDDYVQVYPGDRGGLAQNLLRQAQLRRLQVEDKPIENMLLGF